MIRIFFLPILSEKEPKKGEPNNPPNDHTARIIPYIKKEYAP